MSTHTQFTYTGETTEGTEVRQTVSAPDRYAVYDIAREQGHTVHAIREAHRFSARKFLSMEPVYRSLSKVKDDDIVMMTRNLSAMMKAGLPLSRALSVSQRQSKNPKLRHVLGEIGTSINNGASLYESLREFPQIFSPLYIAMVRAGEESGMLSETLATISIQMERSSTLKKKIRGAMIYPTIVIVAMCIIGALMMIFVVPTLVGTFSELNVELPTATQILIAISAALSQHTVFVIGILIAFVALMITAARTRVGMAGFAWILLHLPSVGTMTKETYAARTARTLSSLLSSGVDVVTAMKITEDVVQNPFYRKVVSKAAENVERGKPLSETFMRHDHLYPVLFSEMLAAGEEIGQISEMLKEVADFYETEIERKTKNLSTIIGPVLIIVIGGVVGFFALAMISPIYSISDSIG